MFQISPELHHFLWITDRKQEIVQLAMGHIEVITDELQQEYLAWLQSDEYKQYLAESDCD
jgi:hypothetical protein